MVDDALCRLEVQRDRLLAKDSEAAVEPAADQIGVGPRRRHDHGGIGPAERLVDRCRVLRPELLGEAGCARRVGVVDPKLVDARERAQDLRVERAKSAHAEDRDLHSARL